MDKILIWGTGKYCERKYNSIAKLYEISAFVDNRGDKHTFHQKDVITKNCIHEYRWDYIMILAVNFFEILQDISAMGIPEEKVLVGANCKPYIGNERMYMADGRNSIEIRKEYKVIYQDGETDRSVVINNWEDINTYFQDRKKEAMRYINTLPDRPIERAQGALIGKSIKRFYTENYMQKNQQEIQGIVGEMESRLYTKMFGNGEAIEESYIAEYHADFPEEEKYGLDIDLSTGEGCVNEKFDCFICTHTFSYVLNLENAMDNLLKMLKSGGVLLITFAGMLHRASAQELETYKPLYGILPHTIHKILAKYCDEIEYSLETYGNLKCAVATLYGISSDAFSKEELLVKDEDYPLIVGVKIRKMIKSSK